MFKKLSLICLGIILLIGIVNAVPQFPYMVHGTAKISEAIAPGMTIELLNIDTGDNEQYVSLSDGVYGFDLSKFSKGYSNGNELKITYCIDDTRCDERELTDLIVGSDGNKYNMNLDINADSGGSGGSSPYLVFGKVIKGGVEITSGEITVKNINTGISKDIDINSDGYQFNLANFAEGYNTGNTIRITYKGDYVEFIVSGESKEFDVIINTPEEDEIPSSDDSGGSEEIPSPSGAPNINDGIDVTLSSEPISFEGIEKSQFKVNIKGWTHIITLFRVYDDSAEIWIQSNPIKLFLKIGEYSEVDVDGDDEKDIRVYLESIIDGNAKILISNVDLGIPDGGIEVEPEIREFPEGKRSNSVLWILSLLGVICIAAIGYYVFKKAHRGGEGNSE